MSEITGCHGRVYAQWDSDGCTCIIDGLLVWNPAKDANNVRYPFSPNCGVRMKFEKRGADNG